MAVRISAVLGQLGALCCVLVGVIIFTGCESDASFPHAASRWLRTQTYWILFGIQGGPHDTGKRDELIFADDGKTALYINASGTEGSYQVDGDELCFVGRYYSYCLGWRVEADRLSICGFTNEAKCREFVRPEDIVER